MTLLHRKPKLQSNFQSRLSSLLYPPSSCNVSFKCYSSSCEKSWCLLALPALCVVVGLPLWSAMLGEGKRKSEIGTWVLIFTVPWMFSSRAHSDFTDVCITLWGRVKMSALGGSAHHPKYRQWKLWADTHCKPMEWNSKMLPDGCSQRWQAGKAPCPEQSQWLRLQSTLELSGCSFLMLSFALTVSHFIFRGEHWSVVQVLYGEEHFALKPLLFVQMSFHALFLSSMWCADAARRTGRDFPRAEFPMWMAALCAPSLGWWLCAGADLECLCTSQWDQVKPRLAFDPWLSTKKASQDNYRNIQVITVPLLFWCREL